MKTSKLKMIVAACVLTTSLSVPTFAQKDAKKTAEKENDKKFEDSKMEKDVDFVVDAANDGMYEVQVGELANTNATSEKVKQLAERMVKDHSKANEELKMVAAKKNITLPAKLSDKRQKDFDELTKLKGADFDKKYAKAMVSDHKDAIDLFQKEADKGMDGELKAWAAGKIPTLKQHLSMAEEVRDFLNKSKDEVSK
jgi:putative membrane protein